MLYVSQVAASTASDHRSAHRPHYLAELALAIGNGSAPLAVHIALSMVGHDHIFCDLHGIASHGSEHSASPAWPVLVCAVAAQWTAVMAWRTVSPRLGPGSTTPGAISVISPALCPVPTSSCSRIFTPLCPSEARSSRPQHSALDHPRAGGRVRPVSPPDRLGCVQSHCDSPRGHVSLPRGR
jgi:hypothetical protein